jgi:leader peptidase (prepilin peptidase)/N-methyltransferase
MVRSRWSARRSPAGIGRIDEQAVKRDFPLCASFGPAGSKGKGGAKMVFSLWVFILGAAIGSFLNVCIVRLPQGKSLVRPGSHCPRCGKTIRLYDNIPLVSYLILRGRCRDCKGPISPRYFLVETVTALFSLAIVRNFGLTLEAAIYFVLFCVLLVIIFIDLDTFTIPDIITLPGIAAGLGASFLLPRMGILRSAVGLVAGGGILFVVAIGYRLLRKREGIGGGDIKLLAMIGAFLGLPGVIFTLFTSSLVGAFAGFLLMARQKSGGATMIPYGPFLSLGAMGYVFWGPSLIQWYLLRLGGPT